MPTMREGMTSQDRWDLVAHIRSLQKEGCVAHAAAARPEGVRHDLAREADAAIGPRATGRPSPRWGLASRPSRPGSGRGRLAAHVRRADRELALLRGSRGGSGRLSAPSSASPGRAGPDPLLPLVGARLASFLPAAARVLVIIVAGAAVAPSIAEPSGLARHAGAGRPVPGAERGALRSRLALLPPAGGRRRPRRRPGRAVGYLLVFAVVLSVWAFDFVLGPDPDFAEHAHRPLRLHQRVRRRGRLVTCSALARGVLFEQGRDAGALLLALAIFWAYLFWSQYLTIWYGNLPDEIGFALRRAADGWGAVVSALPSSSRCRSSGSAPGRPPLAARARTVVVVQLVGLWLNCNLMVLPLTLSDWLGAVRGARSTVDARHAGSLRAGRGAGAEEGTGRGLIPVECRAPSAAEPAT